MPEAPELRLMRDYINHLDVDFYEVTKSEISKLKDPNVKTIDTFKIKAITRGKELRLIFSNHIDDMIWSMGMSGSWKYVWLDNSIIPKHAHVMFYGELGYDNVCLCMVDPRRFAKYKWTPKNQLSDRGHDPVDEFELFKENILKASKKQLDTKLNEILMNQSLFSGVGNYIRAEVIFRLNINPFQTLQEIIDSNKLDDLCLEVKSVMDESYVLGGGQLYTFKNPFEKEATSFKEWLLIYGKGESLIDKTGRKFWYDLKWKSIADKIYQNKY